MYMFVRVRIRMGIYVRNCTSLVIEYLLTRFWRHARITVL